MYNLLHLFNLATWHTEILLLFSFFFFFNGGRGFIFNVTVMGSCIFFFFLLELLNLSFNGFYSLKGKLFLSLLK